MTSIWAITMVKDEADVIERSLRHMANQGVDVIICADNQSTDGTREILEQLARPGALNGNGCTLILADDTEVAYYQARKMSSHARLATNAGADWIVPFDADELWSPVVGGEAMWPLRFMLHHQEPDVGVVAFKNYHHTRVVDGAGGHPFDAMGWRKSEPLPLPKVAFRAHAAAQLEMGNHGVSGVPGRRVEPFRAEIHHYPYRSVEQFISKAVNGSRAYEATGTDMPETTGQHWRNFGAIYREGGPEALAHVYRAEFVVRDPEAAGYVWDVPR